MAEHFVRVMIGEGDELTLSDMKPGESTDWEGSINGALINVRITRADPDEDEENLGDNVTTDPSGVTDGHLGRFEFTLVNEDSVEYARCDNWDEASDKLAEYPNDQIVVRIKAPSREPEPRQLHEYEVAVLATVTHHVRVRAYDEEEAVFRATDGVPYTHMRPCWEDGAPRSDEVWDVLDGSETQIIDDQIVHKDD